MSNPEFNEITPLFEEMGVEDISSEFSVEINEMLQQGKLSDSKIYKVMIPKNPDEPYGMKEFIAILTYRPSFISVYYREMRANSRISKERIEDAFGTSKKYEK